MDNCNLAIIDLKNSFKMIFATVSIIVSAISADLVCNVTEKYEHVKRSVASKHASE